MNTCMCNLIENALRRGLHAMLKKQGGDKKVRRLCLGVASVPAPQTRHTDAENDQDLRL